MAVPAVKGGYANHGDGKGVTYALQLAFKKNEDRVIFEADLEAFDVTPHAGKLHAFFCVLDGHNGPLMSEHASKKLLVNILNCLPKGNEKVASHEGVLEAAIKEGFRLTEDEIRNTGCACICGPPRGGSTVCGVFIRSAPGEWGGPPPLQLVCANSGDSRAILCSLPSEETASALKVGMDGRIARPSRSTSDIDGSWHGGVGENRQSSADHAENPSGAKILDFSDVLMNGRSSADNVLDGASTPSAPSDSGAGDSMRRSTIPAVQEDAELQCPPEDSIKSGMMYPEDSMRSGSAWQYDSDSVRGGVEGSVAAGKRNYRAIKKTYSIQAPGDKPDAYKTNPIVPPPEAELRKGVALSDDHAAETNAEEVVRIRSAGGHVAKSKRGSMEVGPLRVYPGGYAVSRSLGDFDCKYVICEPEIRVIALPQTGGRVVIASDGLFGFVTTAVAASIVRGYVWPEDAAIALMRHVSISYGILDDTSIIVVDVVGSSSRAMASGWKLDAEGFRQVDPADIQAAVNLDDLTVHPPGAEITKQSLLYELVLGERLLDAVPSRRVGNPDGKPLGELYEVTTLLGKGHFASVRLVTERATGKKRALKSETIASVRKEVMCNELDTLVAVSGKHPALPTVYATFQEDGCLHIVTDACLGGTLLSYVASQDDNSFTEDELRHVMTQLIEAVDYCHSLNIVHRDVKPDNVIMRDPPGTPGLPRIMLVDFGSAIFCFKEKSSDEIGFHGTGYYAAPEIFKKAPYGFKSDVFSIGVTLHSIVAGLPPLKRIREVIAELRKGELPTAPEGISEDLTNFIKVLITPDPVSRPSAKAALRHPWIRAGGDPAQRAARREARLKQAKEERAKGGRPGLIRRNSFVMAAKGAQAARDYEAQVATVLPMLLTVAQCEDLYARARALAAKEKEAHAAADSVGAPAEPHPVDELSTVGARDMETILQDMSAPLAASQLAAIRIKLGKEARGDDVAVDDGDGMGISLKRLGELCQSFDHHGYVQESLAAGGAGDSRNSSLHVS